MLEIAGRVFAERGFHHASMDEIATEAGTSKPMLYSYFGSKEGLYVAYVNLSYQQLVAAIDAAVSRANGQPEHQLRAGMLAFFEYVGAHRNAFFVLFREMDDTGMLADQRRRLRRRVANALEYLLGQPGPAALAPIATEALAEAVQAAARSLANWWLDHPEVPAEAISDRLVDVVVFGMRGLIP